MLHRHLNRAWADSSDRPAILSYSEYEYLRAIERLDGAQIARAEASEDDSEDDETGGRHDDHHGHHLQDLVDILGVQKASASAAIAKLEKRGLVERFPCQFDARAQHVMLTNKARLNLRTEETVYTNIAAKLASKLDPRELNALTTALEKVGKTF
jgi:DNA-binding MarR family transcriptional regulator